MHIKPLDYVNNNELFLVIIYEWTKEVMKTKSQFHFSVTNTIIIDNTLVVNLSGEHKNSKRMHFACLKRH